MNMRITFSALFFLTLSFSGFASDKRIKPPNVLAATTQSGYPVNINSSGQNNENVSNPSQKPLIIIARCNATVANKDLEGWVRLSSPPTLSDMVASLSGTGRQTITFVVPWNWYYRVNVVIPTGGDCSATAWLTN